MKLMLPVVSTALLLSLVACVSPEPPLTLPQKLSAAGTTEEKKEMLRLACLNEAEHIGRTTIVTQRGKRDTFGTQTSTAKNLCRRMTDAYDVAGAEVAHERQDLSKECDAFVQKGLEAASTSNVAHYRDLAAICERMTD
jgi:hypothetical protein